MFSQLRPINDNILVLREKIEDKTQGGIYMSAASDEKSCIGEVIAVGPGKIGSIGVRQTPVIAVGDKVYFPKFGGVELDSDYIMLREDNILGVFCGTCD